MLTERQDLKRQLLREECKPTFSPERRKAQAARSCDLRERLQELDEAAKVEEGG